MPAPTTSGAPSFSPPSQKRFQDLERTVSPVIALDRDGTIFDTTRAARQLLEYGADTPLDGSFFAHIHARHRDRVMHDLADMVCRGKQRAQWLLRMRTGNQRWRWYRVSAHNHLRTESDDCLLLHLRPV